MFDILGVTPSKGKFRNFPISIYQQIFFLLLTLLLIACNQAAETQANPLLSEATRQLSPEASRPTVTPTLETTNPLTTMPSPATATLTTTPAVTPTSTLTTPPTKAKDEPSDLGLASVDTPSITPPAQPLQAWSVAPDGAVFVLDADSRLHQLDPADLSPLAQSEPLFPTPEEPETDLWIVDTPAGRWSFDFPAPGPYLLAAADQVFVGNRAITQTLVLDRQDFSPIIQLEQAGPMALDPGRHLFMIPQKVDVPTYSWQTWAFDLSNLGQAPEIIDTSCPSGPPVVDSAARRLYLQMRNCINSPPHRRDTYSVFNLDTLALITETEDFGPGRFDRLTIAEQAGVMATVYHHANYLNQLVILDPQGQVLSSTEPILQEYGLSPVIDAQGEWLYLINGRALEVRRVADLSLQSRTPLTNGIPADIALSKNEQLLHLFGNDLLETRRVTDLQQAGIEKFSDFPLAWLHNPNSDTPLVKLFRSPEFEHDGAMFVLLDQPFEGYRYYGRSWEYLSTLNRQYWPAFSTMGLSLSPTYSHDQTVIALSLQPLRSTNGGKDWDVWEPRLAFTTDRDGNREIYTMNESGEDLQRLTNNTAADENAAWSPAWTRLAFQSDRNGNWDIFSLNPDCFQTECELQQLTANSGDNMLPAWSPDGRRIAFVSTRDGNPEIYVMDANGQNQRRLTFDEHGDWRPAWLLDSQHLVFTSGRNGTNDIYQLNIPLPDLSPFALTDPEVTSLITGDSDDRDPAIHSDGTIYFLSDREGAMKIFTYRTSPDDEDAEPKIEVFNQKVEQPQAHPSPALSAYTSDLIIAALTQNGRSDVYRLSYYSADPLTDSPGFDGQPAAGPTIWNPDPDISREWLLRWQGD